MQAERMNFIAKPPQNDCPCANFPCDFSLFYVFLHTLCLYCYYTHTAHNLSMCFLPLAFRPFSKFSLYPTDIQSFSRFSCNICTIQSHFMHFSHSIPVFLFNPHNFCVHFYSRHLCSGYIVYTFLVSLYLICMTFPFFRPIPSILAQIAVLAPCILYPHPKIHRIFEFFDLL